MRPRRTILLYCVSEQERSVLKLLLELHFYRIIGGISALPPLADLAIVVDDRTLETVTMAKTIASLHPAMHMLAIPAPKYRTLAHGFPAQAEMLSPGWVPAVLLERINILMARKRGPKRGWRAAQMIEVVA